jgi:hypothetical protein
MLNAGLMGQPWQGIVPLVERLQCLAERGLLVGGWVVPERVVGALAGIGTGVRCTEKIVSSSCAVVSRWLHQIACLSEFSWRVHS